MENGGDVREGSALYRTLTVARGNALCQKKNGTRNLTELDG